MHVSLEDIFVCAGGGDENQAFLCKESGKLYYHSHFCDEAKAEERALRMWCDLNLIEASDE
jgi:hypothetical protein